MKTCFTKFFTLAGLLLTQVAPAQSLKKFTFGRRVGANFSHLDDLSYQTPRLDGIGPVYRPGLETQPVDRSNRWQLTVGFGF